MDPPVVWETQAGEQEGGWPWQEWRALPPKPAGHAPGALVRSAHPGRCHGGVGDEVRAQNGDSAAERTSGVCLAGSELGGSGPCGRVHPSLTGQWPRVAFPTCGPRMSSLGGCVSCSGLIWPAGSPQQLSTHGCPLVPPWLESWPSPRPCSRPCPPPTEVAPAALPPACSTCSGFFPESRSPPSAPPPPRIPSLSGQHWNAYGVEHRVTTSPAGFGRMQVGSPFPRAHTSHQVHMVGFRSLSATHSHFPSGGHRGCYSHGVWLPWMPAPSACISGVSQGEGARGNSSGVPTGPIP